MHANLLKTLPRSQRQDPAAGSRARNWQQSPQLAAIPPAWNTAKASAHALGRLRRGVVLPVLQRIERSTAIWTKEHTMANGTPTFTRRDAILGGGGLVLGILGRSAMDLAAPATPARSPGCR